MKVTYLQWKVNFPIILLFSNVFTPVAFTTIVQDILEISCKLVALLQYNLPLGLPPNFSKTYST